MLFLIYLNIQKILPDNNLNYLLNATGPLTALVNGRITVVGIVSFGRTSCTPLVANGYERVTFQMDWILNSSDAAAWQCGAAIGKLTFKAYNF